MREPYKLAVQYYFSRLFGWLTRCPGRLRILTFHSIEPDVQAGGGEIALDTFEQFLAFLQESGYTTCRVCDLAQHWPAILQRRNVVTLTFDDGYANHRDRVCTLLQRYGMTGTFFIPTSWIDTTRVTRNFEMDNGIREKAFLCWDDLRAMQAQGFEIGAHGHRHTLIAQLDRDRAQDEIVRSKALLEDHLGVAVTSFSYPKGRTTAFAPWTGTLLRDAGYLAGCTMMGWTPSTRDDVLTLPRIDINDWDTPARFRMKLAGAYDFFRRLRRQ